MAATHVFTCTCGIQKKTSNHWILALVTRGSIRFVPWDSALALRDDVIVLCGERCAAALLSRSLGDWKAAAANPASAPAATRSFTIASSQTDHEPLTVWEEELALAAA